MFDRREFALLNQRLTRIEQSLDLVMRRLEIDPGDAALQPLAGISPRVRELAGEGRIVHAVRQLRTERPRARSEDRHGDGPVSGLRQIR